MVQKKVTIVILTWNGLAYTRQCLQTLRNQTLFPYYEVIVVDNGSTDGSVEYLKSISWIRLIENSRNLGFVKGNNQGIQASDPESDIVLLNNDTEIFQPAWLSRLQESAHKSTGIGIVGARLRLPDGKLLHAGTYMPIETYWGQQIGSGEKDINQFNIDAAVEGVVFACVYIRREVIDRAGLLDEAYFSYFEDSDYCLTAQKHGFKVICCGSATLIHHENTSTKVNKVSHRDLFLDSQKIFKKKWQKELESRRYLREVNWHSQPNSATDYAMSSRELVLELDRQNVKVNHECRSRPGAIFQGLQPKEATPYMMNIMRQRRINASGVQIFHDRADAFKTNFNSHKIGYTTFEVDGLPSNWVAQANLMDEIWTPSSFNVESFKKSGVQKPIYIIPPGVNAAYFNPNITGYPIPGVFSFLSLFEWGERAAPETLLKAFNDEFGSSEDVVLVCKVFSSDPSVSISSEEKNFGLAESGGRIIFSVNEVVPAHQLGSLYRSVDCFVLPTRSEGWGLPLLEAMACGLPVIATNWSAQTDFINDEIAYPLNVDRLIPAPAKCPLYKGFSWADPSYEHLRSLMRHVYENRGEGRMKGAKASAEVLSNWTWQQSARKIISRLDQVN
jgi:GT2 family glycosyltransferase